MREQAAQLLSTVAVWVIYLSAYLLIFATLIMVGYALARDVILAG